MSAEMKLFVTLGYVTVILCGCGTMREKSWETPLPVTYVDRASLEDCDEVKMPHNYDVNNFNHQPQLAVAVKIEKDGKSIVTPELGRRLEGEMDRLKHFKVFTIWGYNKDVLDDIGDVDDEVKIAKAKVRESDFVLSGTINVTVSENKFRLVKEDGGSDFVYLADGDFFCDDARTRTRIFSEKARGTWGRRVLRRVDSKVFDSSNGEAYGLMNDEKVIHVACTRCVAIMANKLGNRFPVGGKVVSINRSGESMVINAGSNEGIIPGQQVVLFHQEDKMPTPLAYGEATPSMDGTSVIKVYRWSEDKDAEAIIKELKESPKKYLKSFDEKSSDGLYAVACGMPPPADWEKNVNK